MSQRINQDHIAAYRRDGVTVVRRLLDDRWLQVLARGVEENLRRPSPRTADLVDDPAGGGHFFFDARTLGEVDAYDRVMMDSPMAEAAARLMGSSRAVLFYMSVFVRAAGTRARTPWHQDQPSWSAEGRDACSIWVSLDPVPRDTALEFVRGSHLWSETFERPEFFHHLYEGDDRTDKAPFPDIDAHRHDFDILAWDMEPGDALVFHGMTIHGGSGNLPPGLARRNVSVQWLGDDACFRPVPDRDDQHISEELLNHGIRPGDPMICDICPIAWPR